MEHILPNPVFEGSEKRVEIDFQSVLPCGDAGSGLRALTRPQLDELMTAARCTIVSNRSNQHFDAYVLSESSLFVYPTKWVLKTCGTTRLLNSVPLLLEYAAALGLEPRRCKFTRASFLFPEQQPFPHSGFEDEVVFLDQHFGSLDPEGRQAYVLGEPVHGLQWHVYVAGRHTAPKEPTFNLEVCCTELGAEAAQQFFRTPAFVSSAQTTIDTGIINLKPGAVLDDYVFEPCGYSMNGIDATGFITIHVTPELGFSYASVEISGHKSDMVDANALIAQVLRIFNPGKVSVAVSVDDALAPCSEGWGDCLHDLPLDVAYQGATCQQLACGGRILYYTVTTPSAAAAAAAVAAAAAPDSPAAAALKAAPSLPVSPKTVLRHMPSFLSSPLTSDNSSTSENASVASSDTEGEPLAATSSC